MRMQIRRASIKETGEELSEADWARFDEAVAQAKAERGPAGDQKDPAPGVKPQSVPRNHASEGDLAR